MSHSRDERTALVTDLHRTLIAVADVLAPHLDGTPAHPLIDAADAAATVMLVAVYSVLDLHQQACEQPDAPGWDQALTLLDVVIQDARRWRDEHHPAAMPDG